MKIIYTILTVLMLASTAIAQQQDTLQVDITKMSQQELLVYQQLKQKEAQSAMSLENLTPENVNKYAQMGKGMGIAINEGLGAVTTNVEQFSQTSAGKWLMLLITWKVMGTDAIGLTRTVVQWMVGGLLLIVGIPFWIWIVRRNCVLPPIKSIEKTGFWGKKVTYSDRPPVHEDSTVFYGLGFLVYLAVTAGITFVH